MEQGCEEKPVIYYFVNYQTEKDLKYIESLIRLGYPAEQLKVILTNVNNLYEKHGDEPWFVDPYLYTCQSNEEVRIVQTGVELVEYIPLDKDIYSIGIVTDIGVLHVEKLNGFGEIWTTSDAFRKVLVELGISVPIEVVEEDITKVFDPLSLLL